MDRRKYIKETILQLPILLAAPSILAGCEADQMQSNDKTIVIIGAGLSGLAAAEKLNSLGFKVIILEAQDKIGGRLRTNRTLNIAFDEGASWIHGIDGNPIFTLANKAGMDTFETKDESRINYDFGGKERSSGIYQKAEDELYEILDSLMKSGSANQSFKTVFNNLYPSKANDRLWKFLLSTYITFDCGDLDKLSSLLYNEGEEYSGAEKIVTNGYDTIANYLAKGLNIQLNQKVTKIDFSNNKVKITHIGNVTEADYVIVTVPLGVLKANKISFEPMLPTYKLNAVKSVGMNCVNKFLLVWDSTFWDDVQYISYTPEVPDKFNYFVNLNTFHPKSNALMTFAYAEYGRQTEQMTDEQVIAEIMLHLKDIYGNNIPNPKKMLRTKWQSNENSFGAYSFTAMETEMKHFEDLAKEINDQLFFAGEHTEVDYFSTAHGAYLSGIREAEKIIKLLN